MSNLTAKLARQQQQAEATKTSIARIIALRDKSKDADYRINCNLVLVQLQTKLTRQLRAIKLTEFEAKL